MKNAAWWLVVSIALTGAVACGTDGDSSGKIQSYLEYDEAASNVLVGFNRDLGEGEVLHARVRSLAEGESLDCKTMSSEIGKYSSKVKAHTYQGPQVVPTMFEDPTNPNTLLGETEETYQQRQANTWFVDVCVMKDSGVAHQARYDLRQALDEAGGGKGDQFDDGVKIVSNQAYAEACVQDLGDIPFWGERLGEDGELDWSTVDCMEIGTPIPSTIDGVPQKEHRSDKCDDPQYIYRHCEADATTGANGPRVAHARNDEGTHWVLLCRKSHETLGRFEDVAMIGHNPFTGQTCFFQNQLPYGSTEKPSNNGMKIPHPADNVESDDSPETWNSLWGGIQGGIGQSAGINCQGCHSTDPFIHTPWIDGALNENGHPVVPKMGFDPDFVEGYNGPYRLLDAEDQGWSSPKMLVSEEASSCTSCHRIALDQWTAPSNITSRDNEDGGCVFCGQALWLDRLENIDEDWRGRVTEAKLDFKSAFWMPPNAHEVLNQEVWPDSDYKKAMDFIRMCGAEPTNPACIWESLPEEPGDPSELPEIEETGEDLALEALAILGAPYVQKDGAEVENTSRCAECHAVSKNGFKDWLSATKAAFDKGINPLSSPEELSQEDAKAIVDYMRKGDEGSVFAAAKIGVFAPGVQYPYFQQLFQKAYGNAWGIQYGSFLQRVSMPKGSHAPLSAREFAVINKWFVDENLAHLEEFLKEVPPPATCAEVEALYGMSGAAPWLQNHVDDMEFDGWKARNEEAGINNFACKDDNAMACFETGYSDIKEWSSGDINGLRLLEIKDLGFDTSFWMRSSADGRFVGNGGRGGDDFGATITDLIADKNIGVKGSYDPGFFPNNGGFIMQGQGAGLCGQSVLTRTEAIEGGIDFTEDGCSKAEGINLYQHVAVNLDGGDYFIINSQFTSDSGSSNEDPRAPFSETSTMKFSPLIFDGAKWTQKPAIVVKSPYEGDSVLSPSGRIVISRFAGPSGVALGYMLRRVETTPAGDSYDISIKDPVQFLCTPGAKANISFDERFSVTHHYEGETANLFVSDLITGVTTRVTNMPTGTKALFPHFRSDGWIYFLATGGEDGDKAMATDAALILAEGL